MRRRSAQVKAKAAGNNGSARPSEAVTPAKWTIEERSKRLHSWLTTLSNLRMLHDQLRDRNTDLQASLRAVEQERLRYEVLFKMAPDGYLVTNEADVIVDANRVAQAMLNYPSPLIGHLLTDFVAEADRERLRALYFQLETQSGHVKEMEIVMQPTVASCFPAVVRAMMIKDWKTGRSSFRWLFRDMSDRKRFEDLLRQRQASLRDSQVELRTLATRLITAQDEERQRISRDLHDDINQRLALLAIDLETLEREMPASSGQVRKKLETIRTRVTDLSGDLRGLAYRLHSTIQEDLGLPIALKRYADDYTKRTGIKCLVVVMDEPKTLPKEIGSALFKITQECLGNILKHAQANEVLITLAGGGRFLQLSVRDNGVGFEADSAAVRSKGMGFVSMRERVLMLGGEFLVESEQGRGSLVTVRVPFS